MPEQAIQKYLDKIEDLQEEVESNKKDILKMVNLDLLKLNPKEYLTDLSMDIYEAHQPILNDAIDAGEKKADIIISKYVKTK